jgi:hypothetical protein
MSGQQPPMLFHFDPVPHKRNKETDVFGKSVIGRWTTTEEGKKASIARLFILIFSLDYRSLSPDLLC